MIFSLKDALNGERRIAVIQNREAYIRVGCGWASLTLAKP